MKELLQSQTSLSALQINAFVQLPYTIFKKGPLCPFYLALHKTVKTSAPGTRTVDTKVNIQNKSIKCTSYVCNHLSQDLFIHIANDQLLIYSLA